MTVLSEAGSRAVNASETDEIYIQLLTLTHDTLLEPIRVCDDPKEMLIVGQRGVTSRGDDFVFLPFQLVRPGQADDYIPAGRLTIDNVSREIIQAVRSINTAVKVKMEIVLASNPDIVELAVEGFYLRNITADQMVVTGELTLRQFDTEPFPKGRFTPSKFPGLFSS